jgi:hypothetical protein
MDSRDGGLSGSEKVDRERERERERERKVKEENKKNTSKTEATKVQVDLRRVTYRFLAGELISMVILF